MRNPDWEKIANGVWSARIGEIGSPTPLSIVDRTPRLDAINRMAETAFPLDRRKITWERVGNRLVVCLPLDDDEKLYGLGLHFMRVNHRGRTRYLRVNSDPRIDTGETHAPVPFYVSSRGYGVLANTARIVTIHCASTGRLLGCPDTTRDRNTDPNWRATPTSNFVEIVVADGGLELFLFGGDVPLDAVRRYNLFCGGGCLPPRWGLGFWHRVPTRYTDEEAIAEAGEFRHRRIPCDVIGLEPGWHTRSYPSTYDWSDRFPDPGAFVKSMSDMGFRVNLWEHPYVSPHSSIYESLRPYAGSHTVWGGLVPDYTLPQARKVLMDQHDEKHVSIGVSGYKLDECDGSELTGNSWMFPAHATFPSGVDGEQMRQIYGLILQKMTDDLFRARDRRTYGLVRASSAGASSMPYVLYSDLYDHRQFVRALCNSTFSGLLWTPEVRRAGNQEEWVRRMQVVCLSPLAMLNAWSSGTKPWTFEEVEPIVRKYINLRMQLQPYLYSAFARYYFDGIPPFRAMALCDGASDWDTDDQFMVGDCLLVAPLFAGEKSRTVKLPPGRWYDFETGEPVGEGEITVTPDLSQLPMFVRDGGIIPMMPVMQCSPRPGEKIDLEIRHYGELPSNAMLFDDDGETFAFERGESAWWKLSVTVDENGNKHGEAIADREIDESSYGKMTWKFM